MFDTQVDQDICISTLRGPFSIDDVYDMITFTESVKVSGLLLDIGEQRISSSTIMGLIISLYNGLKENDIRFCVVSNNRESLEVLRLEGLHLTFPIFESLPTGLDYLKNT